MARHPSPTPSLLCEMFRPQQSPLTKQLITISYRRPNPIWIPVPACHPERSSTVAAALSWKRQTSAELDLQAWVDNPQLLRELLLQIPSLVVSQAAPCYVLRWLTTRVLSALAPNSLPAIRKHRWESFYLTCACTCGRRSGTLHLRRFPKS